MIYVTSDLHGIPLKDLKQLLKSVNFSNNDWLFILGDVIDRQNDGGVEILKWLLLQSNVQLILGNHEAMLLGCHFVFDEITNESIENLSQEKMELLMTYWENGGDITLETLKTLKQSDPEIIDDIFDYLRNAPLYETVSIGGNDFVLVHAGLGNFNKNKKLSDYTANELLWPRPDIDQEYYEDIITILGHTPTLYFSPEYSGKILRTKTWIDIDVGVQCGKSPALLRLDDLKEFYL